MMRGVWSSLPNRITAVRLAALPLLWLLAITRETTWLGIGVAIAAFTDVLDGFIARRTGTTTEVGSRLDSIADHLLTASTVLWLLMLRPEFFARERVPLLIWAAFATLVLLVGWVRFHRIGGLHLYSAKVAAVLGFVFAIWLLLTGSYAAPFFYTVLAVATLAAIETLAVFLAFEEVDENAGSIVMLLSRRRTGL
jgi:phosphatidylglycerophosphate synthase